ncbi:hypothetical protein ABPG74_009547 [Tetrahymena malaccensis]
MIESPLKGQRIQLHFINTINNKQSQLYKQKKYSKLFYQKKQQLNKGQLLIFQTSSYLIFAIKHQLRHQAYSLQRITAIKSLCKYQICDLIHLQFNKTHKPKANTYAPNTYQREKVNTFFNFKFLVDTQQDTFIQIRSTELLQSKYPRQQINEPFNLTPFLD